MKNSQRGITWNTVRLLAVATMLLIAAQVASALCVEWPMRGWDGVENVPGHGYYIMQSYANRGGSEWFSNKAHSGIDLAADSGAADTANDPVYAAADGVVKCVVNAYYPGYVVVIEHDNGTYYTQYGHLNATSLQEETWVSVGTQIGTVIDQGSNSHLHFEVRTFEEWSPGNCWGPGYADNPYEPGDQGWLDPVDWYFQNRPPFPGTGVSSTTVNVRSAPRIDASLIGTLNANVRRAVSSVNADQNGAPHWWYRIQYDGVNYGYSAGYWDDGSWGGDLLVTEPSRSCSASGSCRDHDGDVSSCDATPGCAYYFCSNQCHPTGTSLCDAGCC